MGKSLPLFFWLRGWDLNLTASGLWARRATRLLYPAIFTLSFGQPYHNITFFLFCQTLYPVITKKIFFFVFGQKKRVFINILHLTLEIFFRLCYHITMFPDLSGIPENSTVAVAVSGGCDSMCLLHYMSQVAGKCGFTVAAINVEHGIRGE